MAPPTHMHIRTYAHTHIRTLTRTCTRPAAQVVDGELSARVFGLLRIADQGLMALRYGGVTRQRLDTSLLSFLQAFRKVYIGEQVRGVACPVEGVRSLAAIL